MSSAPSVPWLEESEMELWRAWLRAQTELPAAMGRALHADSELSLQDFETLVRLSESDDDRLRVSALADEMHWERSRLSHHLRRMGARGLVEKVECAEDGRGAFVVLTRAGREALEGAAPDHVRTVRRLFFDDMGEQEREVITRFLQRVVSRTS
ncbi:Transcriptional regulator, MarR family [Serinicoccus hydrothermalis]|uniref:Transcriptional regulator, MarR family n=1 Tax=Serinicoccus hydrothermalis TaxID=1758689 RepID=A0A1B1NEU9_9MICO|nr:MarR family transcriptional regulator [Serinicoccus hydrothermalis]ANS79964.1 Transcriptional regulator, MarR family [Serinicoccus hydrothermalis]